jgi:hypothetical protein
MRSGFTLLEVVITFAVLMLIMGAVIGAQTNLVSLNLFFSESFLSQREVLGTVQRMIGELREAQSSSAGAYAIERAEAFNIAFYTNIDSDSERERVQYYLSGTDLVRSVVDPVGNPLTYATTTATEYRRTVLRGVQIAEPLFTYYGDEYPTITAPLANPVFIPNVRLIGISVVVQGDSPLSPPVTYASVAEIRILKTNY